MLATTFGELAEGWGWNEMTSEGHTSNNGKSDNRYAIMWNCGVIAIYNTYNYLYGYKINNNGVREIRETALKQDEIMYISHKMTKSDLMTQEDVTFAQWDQYVKTGAKDLYTSKKATRATLVESMYNLYGNSVSTETIAKVLQYLSKEIAKSNVFTADNYTEYQLMIKGLIDQKLPIVVAVPNHFMVIDGYSFDSDDKMVVHLENTDNYGSAAYSYLSDVEIQALVYVTNRPTDFVITNSMYKVDVDTDGDGIVDFDEFYRFGTEPTLKDSDDDGISDFDEIRAYTLRTNLTYSNLVSRNGISFHRPIFADENITFGPELLKDFDGDGIDDGDEDLNKNGIVDEGETDPFFAIDGGTYGTVPGNFTLYGINHLSIYDNAVCKSGKGPCNIAVEGNKDSYGLRLGTGTEFSNVYAKSKVDLYTDKMQNILLYKDFYADDVNQRNGEPVQPTYLNSFSWNWFADTVGLAEKFVSSEKDTTIAEGDTLVLRDSASYRNVIVKSGATLALYAGDIFIDSLGLEEGSQVLITRPKISTTLHINNKLFWKGSFLNASTATLQSDIASGFRIIQHNKAGISLETPFYGTVFNPLSNVEYLDVNAYHRGRALGRQVYLDKNAKLEYESFNPCKAMTNVCRPILEEYAKLDSIEAEAAKDTTAKDTTVKDSVPEAIKDIQLVAPKSMGIKAITRNSISFEVKSTKPVLFQIVKENGVVVKSFRTTPKQIGLNTIGWNGESIAKGKYIMTMQNDINACGKAFTLK